MACPLPYPCKSSLSADTAVLVSSSIVTYLHRRKSQQAKAQSAASSTWGATAATDERKSEDNAYKVVEGYREPNRDEADNLAPARGIVVSVLVGIAMWLAIVALVLLITWFLRDPT